MAAAWLSPVSRIGVRPSRLSSRTASAELGFTVSATAIMPRATPSQPTTTAVAPRCWAALTAYETCSGTDMDRSSKSRSRPTTTSRPSTVPATPSPSRLTKSSTGGTGPSSVAATAMARATGCAEAASAAPATRRSVAPSSPGAGTTSARDIWPVVTVPVLSSSTVSTGAGGLQDLRAPDEQAELGPSPRAHHEGRGGGETQGAGAGDDEHRHGRGERGGPAAAHGQPADQGGRRDGQDGGDEDRRDPVGQPLHLGLAVLGVLDEPGQLLELGVRADPCRAHDEPAADVDGGTDDRVAWPHVDRHGLAGQQCRVDGARPLDDLAVRGDLLPGAHDEPHADLEVCDRDPFLDRVRAVAVAAQDADVLGAELDQGPQSVAGPSPGPRLGIPPGEQERRDARCRLEVDVVQAAAALEGEGEVVRHARLARSPEEQRKE